MAQKFSGIRVMIWDFDGTLYKQNDRLWDDVRKAEYQTIALHTGWSREKITAEFEKIYKKVTPSATEAVALICNIKTAEAAVEMEKYYDRRPYLSRDPKLITLFETLSTFTHFIFANGARGPIEKALNVLGVARTTFKEIVTSEIVGVNKPHENGFRYILKKTKLIPETHLMIGDREAVDLVPAKSVGMKTCLVWSKKPSKVADITLPTVYDIERFL